MVKITIDIYSDPVCPWCYIGKRRLEKGIKLYQTVYPGGKNDTFEITWNPYYLDPDMPHVGTPLEEILLSKFGSEGTLARKNRLSKLGHGEGINFTFGGKLGNTRDAHRLIYMAKTRGLEVHGRVVNELFRAYFEENGDITDHEMLIRVAVNAGLDASQVKAWLDNDEGGPEVDEEAKEAKKKLGAGVPHFVIQGEHIIDGAEDPSTFLEAISRVRGGQSD